MGLRLGSLKTRTALTIAIIIAAVLVGNAVYLILGKRKELRQDIEEGALTFAQLSKGPICAAYDAHYASGRDKFRALLRNALRLNPDVTRIFILSTDGQVLYDSRELEEGAPVAVGWVREPERLEALKRLEPTTFRRRTAAGGEMLEIVAPYVEEWGRHRLSVAYQVSYQALRPRIASLVYATAGLTLASILAAALVAVTLATGITRPLAQLTAGATDIAEGRLENRLDIRSGDELQILAEAFNNMAVRLRENIQKLEESNRKLAAANEELKELDHLKSDLLANVSHELRTPLTAVKGYTDYMLERKLGPVTQKQEKGLVVVQRNLDRLSRSISALLDFARMDAGRFPLNIAPFSLSLLVEQVATGLRSEMEKKRLSFGVFIEPDLPPLIGDRDKLSAVLENLVVNAIKFTGEGGRISVSAARVPVADRPTAEVRVTDTGIGIPLDQVEKVFNRFHQVDGSTTRRYGGVGLGLAIVKSILDAHGAPITVESEVQRGTVFRFALPVMERHEVAPAERPPERPDGALVLVVDDEEDARHMLRAFLEEEGLTVVTASTAAEAASRASDRRPDLILLDLLLPDKSGLDFLAALKGEPATRDVPVLVISIVSDATRALNLGAADVLTKPFERAHVMAAVRRLLRTRGERRVLVVHGARDTAERIRDTLMIEGFRPLVVADGHQGLQALARERPDAAIVNGAADADHERLREALGQAVPAVPVITVAAGAVDAPALVAEVKRRLGRTVEMGTRGATA